MGTGSIPPEMTTRDLHGAQSEPRPPYPDRIAAAASSTAATSRAMHKL